MKRRNEFDFEWNVLRHLDAANNLARWLLGNLQDAEDVVQDSAIRAFAAYSSFRGSDAKPWFLAIVRNGCMNRLRHRSRMQPLEENVEDSEPSPEALVVRAWEAETVRMAIDGLPVEFREVIVLRELEEMSYKEIAAVTGLPIGTVMSRLTRARGRLAAALGGAQ